VISHRPLSLLEQVERKKIDFNLETGLDSGVIDKETVLIISVSELPTTSP